MNKTINFIPFKYIIKSPVTSLLFDEQIFLILKWARKQESKIVCLANVHMLMEANRSPEFAAILESADLVAPDGTPLVWMLQKMGNFEQDRVAGMDVFQRLCELCSLAGISVFFLGSEIEILQKIRKNLEKDFPDLKVAGMETLPFRPLTPEEDQEIIDTVNNSQAGIVFISLGCPKQEYFMSQHYQKINSVMIGLGAVFPIYAGLHKRAPKYIRELGFEWLYRLIQEPGRLWKRYLSTIPAFIVLALKQLLNRDQYLSEKDLISNYDFSNSQEVYTKLGELLLRQDLISQEQLLMALEEQKNNHKKLGEILIERNLITLPELKYYLKNQQLQLEEFLIFKRIVKEKVLRKFNKFKIPIKNLRDYVTMNRLFQELSLRKNGYWLTRK